MDFKAVLEAISQTELPMPYHRTWAKAGMVGGRGSICDIAWRTLDAQFFNVAQRRERVFLVADFGAGGRCADQVLFEWQSLSRDTDKGGAQGEGAAAGAESDTGKASSNKAAYPVNLQIATRHKALGRGTGFGIGENGDPAYTLEAEHSHGACAETGRNCYGFEVDKRFYTAAKEKMLANMAIPLFT